MATTSSPINSKNAFSSTFRKVVCLHDWWLIKAENGFNGKTLAVGGFTSKGTTRIFSSAPIVKRYDFFTLLTADGITVLIKGCINKTRTHENGISFEVCNHFLIGFPFNWEEFNHHFEGGPIPTNIFSQSNECGNLNNEGKSADNNSEDPAVNFVSETRAEDTSNIELLQNGDISKESKADVAIPESLKNNRDGATKSIFNIGDTLKDPMVLKFPVVSGINSTGGKSSSVEKVKYLSNRIHAICGSKKKRTNFCDSASQDYATRETTAKSSLDKDSIASHVDCFGSAQRIILTSPNDARKGSANCQNSNNDAAQRDASNDCLIQPGSPINAVNPSEVDISLMEIPVNCSKSLSAGETTEKSEKENLTNRNPSKVSSLDKVNSDNKHSVSVGVRRSGRLRSVKKPVYANN